MKIFTNILSIFILFSLAACASNPSSSSVKTTGLPFPVITTLPRSTNMPAGAGLEINSSVIQYGLTGRLALIKYGVDGNRLVELNLQTGEIKTLFQAPENSWLSTAAISPDRSQILLAYSPPPPGDEIQFGYTDLYFMAYANTSQPQPFLTRTEQDESYFFPTWAPDGQSIFYSHLRRLDPNSQLPTYQNDIEEVKLSGEKKTVIEHALWPALSPDGARLSYLFSDPVSLGNDLYIANRDGTNQAPVLPAGTYPPIDAHIFSADGSQLIFSMVNPQSAPASSVWDELFGIQVASAHNVPSDWYSVPTDGGNPLRLSSMNEVSLNGDLSPDGSHLIFICSSGLYMMNLDGSDLKQLSNDLFVGSVDYFE